MSRLARFRADPDKVRVAVRRRGRHWLATVTSRSDEDECYEVVAANPAEAVFDALADARHVPGVDIGMLWAYVHPQSRAV